MSASSITSANCDCGVRFIEMENARRRHLSQRPCSHFRTGQWATFARNTRNMQLNTLLKSPQRIIFSLKRGNFQGRLKTTILSNIYSIQQGFKYNYFIFTRICTSEVSGSHIYVSWLVLPFQSKKYFGQNIFLPQMSWYRNYFISIVANNGKEQIKHKTWVLSKFFLLFRKMFQRSFTNSNAAKTERMTLSF